MNKKLLFIMDRNKQVVPSRGDCKFACNKSSYFIVDYVGDVESITRKAYFLNDNKLENKDLVFRVCEHFKRKHRILKVDKHRRDSRSRGQCAFFSLISLKEAENGN
jgi:hypothetical protein